MLIMIMMKMKMMKKEKKEWKNKRRDVSVDQSMILFWRKRKEKLKNNSSNVEEEKISVGYEFLEKSSVIFQLFEKEITNLQWDFRWHLDTSAQKPSLKRSIKM